MIPVVLTRKINSIYTGETLNLWLQGHFYITEEFYSLFFVSASTIKG
jgi:hypothetical protein